MANKRNNVELVAVDGRNAGAGTISNDNGAKDATAPPAKKHKKKTKVDGDDAGADNTSNDDGDKDATAAHTKEKLKKDKEKDRELSPTSEDAADLKSNPDAVHRFFAVFQLKQKIGEEYLAFYGVDSEGSSSSSSSSSQPPKKDQGKKNENKESNKKEV